MLDTNELLPADHAFVIQLRVNSEGSGRGHRGRAEHLASGQATCFADEGELWAFVDKVLDEPTRREDSA